MAKSINLVPEERVRRSSVVGSNARLLVVAIQFQCHECGKTLSVKDDLAGKRVKCPCGAVVVATSGAANLPAGAGRSAGPAPVRTPAPAAVRSSGGNPYFEGSGDLSSLFDELTESDLQTKREREREAAEAHAAVKDPLAAYQPTKGGRASRAGGSGPRPLGLTILAVLNFLLAALMLALGTLFLVGTQVFGDALAEIEFLQEVATFVALMVLIGGAFYAAVGAGLLSGQPWGWWLSASVYAYSACDGIFSIIFSLLEVAPGDNLFKGMGRILFALGVVSYLFNEQRRGYFRVQTQPAIAAAIAIGGAAIIAFGLQMGLHLMMTEETP